MTDTAYEVDETVSNGSIFLAQQSRLLSLTGVITLASLGLIPVFFSDPSLVLLSHTASDGTADVQVSEVVVTSHNVAQELVALHDRMLKEATELDPIAREVLSDHLWELYAS